VNIGQFIVKRRVFFGFVFALAFLYFAKPDVTSVAVGFPFGVLGLAIRAWSSGLIRKNKALATDGPYAMTRNPLYLGSFIAGCGVSIMGGEPILAAVFVFAYLTTYRQIIVNEEAHLAKLFPDELPAYMAAVPRFFPAVTKFKGFGQYDGMHMLKKHKEWQAWLGLLAITGVLLTKALELWPQLPGQ
jgi:protein-S-isoprenylcysteine O-methyltransferase Ste14